MMNQAQSTLKITREGLPKGALQRPFAGQALVELLIFFPLIIALAVGLFSLGFYIQTKTLAVGTARFAAWERSVYADPDNLWSGDAAWEGDTTPTVHATARRSANAIIAGGLAYHSTPNLRVVSERDHTGLAGAGHAGGGSVLWGGRPLSLYSGAGGPVGDFVRDSSRLSQSQGYDGLAALSSYMTTDEAWGRVCDKPGTAIVAGKGAGAWQDRCGGDYQTMPGDSLRDLSGTPIPNDGHRLSRRMLVRQSVSFRLQDLFRAGDWQIALLNFSGLPGARAGDLDISAVAGLYVNPWSPKNEETFRRKVGSLDTGPFVRGATFIHGQINQGMTEALGPVRSQLEGGSVPFLDTFLMAPAPPFLKPASNVQLMTRSIPGAVDNDGRPGPVPDPDGGVE